MLTPAEALRQVLMFEKPFGENKVEQTVTKAIIHQP
jgi:hypothetical protein